MNIFISWSGERSKTAALALKSLLEDVFPQAVTVFISDHINPGENWGQRLGAELEKSQFGILCLTEDNSQAPWLLFEAGALAKSFAASRVVPYLIDKLPASADHSPIFQFQSVPADKDGTLRLVTSINEAKETPHAEQRLIKHFEKWWTDLEHTLKGLPPARQNLDRRSDRDILESIHRKVTALAQERSQPPGPTAELTTAEMLHLVKLRQQPATNYELNDIVKKELRHLRDLGLVKIKQPIATMPEKLQFGDFFSLTEAGETFAAGVRTISE